MNANKYFAFVGIVLAPIAFLLACTSKEPVATEPTDRPAETEDAGDAPETEPLPPLRPTASCELEGVRSVLVPFDPEDPNSRTLELRYRVFPSSRAGAPTVVVVPGGPGGDIMRQSPKDLFALGAIPSDLFTVIYTDARGSGCNAYPNFSDPERGYTIKAVAKDIIAVVKAEKLDNYFIYAASFGTTATTIAASYAEAARIPAPRRLILEGTVGQAFSSFNEYFSPFSAEWIRVKPLLDPVWRREFETEPWSTKLSWSRAQWGAFVSAQLILGDLPGEGPLLKYWLTGLSNQNPAAKKYVSGFMAGVTNRPPSQLFRTIACRELWGSWRTGREIHDGKLLATGSDVCEGTAKDAAYDSSEFQFKVPVTYFHGSFDPTTTTVQAEYHLQNHKRTHRQFVTVPDASHASLTLGLAGRKCARAVWATLDKEPEKLSATLQTCTQSGEAPVTLQTLDTE